MTVEQRIVSLSDCLAVMPKIVVDKRIAQKIKFGQKLSINELDLPLAKPDQFIKVIDNHNDLLAIIQLNENRQEYKYCCIFLS